MYQMLFTINGQQQMSFEQFQVAFREAFGRDMTPDERSWLEPAFPEPDLDPALLGEWRKDVTSIPIQADSAHDYPARVRR